VSSIRTEGTIARAPADVFDYATTPRHWPEWHPSSLGVTGAIDHSMEVGESCSERFVVAGRRGSCVWTARERIPGRRWMIDADTQGGHATIAYALEPDGAGGTRFVRLLEYRMPNVLLAALDALVLRRRIRAESQEALRRLKRRLESGGTSDYASSTSREQAPEE
jgi:uncharacterized protein YndB with AHSA1/START domain